MQENMQVSPVVALMKKAWPAISRIINATVYLIMSIIKNTFKGITDQIKGGT